MAVQTTPNLGLTLPFQTDAVAVSTQNDNMTLIDTFAGSANAAIGKVLNTKVLGSFSTVATLETLLNTELASMTENTNESIKVTASASVDVFYANYAYSGVLYKGVGTDYSHVMLYPSGSFVVVTGAKTTNGWAFERLESIKTLGNVASRSDLETLLDTTLTNMPTGSVKNVRIDATASFDVFASSVAYFGTLRKGASTAYATITFQLLSNSDIIICGGKGSGGWNFYISHFGSSNHTGIEAPGLTAPRAITAGQYVNWRGILYTAKSDIASGATLSTSNLQAVTDGGLNSLMAQSIVPCGTVPNNTALSTVTNPGFYFISSTYTHSDKPLEDCYGLLVLAGTLTGTKFQITFGQQIICLRTISGGAISAWRKFTGSTIS